MSIGAIKETKNRQQVTVQVVDTKRVPPAKQNIINSIHIGNESSNKESIISDENSKDECAEWTCSLVEPTFTASEQGN